MFLQSMVKMPVLQLTGASTMSLFFPAVLSACFEADIANVIHCFTADVRVIDELSHACGLVDGKISTLEMV